MRPNLTAFSRGVFFACFLCFMHIAFADGEWDAGVSTPVCAVPDDQQSPAISSGTNGFVVLWQDNRPDGKKPGTKYPWSVYGRYLEQDEDFPVFVPKDANAILPAVSGNKVVFVHSRGWSCLMLTTLTTLTNANPELMEIEGTAFTPAIDGNLVVFGSGINRLGAEYDKTSWITDIRGFETDGPGIAFDVANSKKLIQSNPVVSGSVVVWQDRRDGTSGGWSDKFIYRRDLKIDADPVRVAGSPGRIVSNPAIYGPVIVWQDNRNGDWDIYGYDLKSDKERAIYMGAGDQTNPKIHGSTVVWQDNRNGNWDIYGADLNTGKVFPVFIGPANQTEPAIFGDVVVWTDDRGNDKDIYMNRGASGAKKTSSADSSLRSLNKQP